MNLIQFAELMEERARRLEKNRALLMKKLALNIVKNLTRDTPVDTGQAISNWQVDFSSLVGTIPPYSPGFYGLTRAENMRFAVAEARFKLKSYQPGNIIVIGNNLPYIGRLNEGYSPQAGANFVLQSVNTAIDDIKGFRILEVNRENLNDD